MNKILAVALNDLRITFRDRDTYIFSLLMPAFLVVAIAFANGAFASVGGERPKVLVDVVDNDQSELSAQFLSTVKALDDTIVLCPADGEEACKLDDPQSTSQRLDDGTIQASLEIPAGFSASLLNDQRVNLVYRSKEDMTQPSSLYSTVQAAASRVSSAIVARRLGAAVAEGDPTFAQDVYTRAAQILATNPASVAFSEAPADEMSREAMQTRPGFRQSVPGMGSMYVMFTVLAGVVILINERKNWTLQRLITMPVSGQQVIAGKMLARFIMGMLQYGVAFGIGLVFAQMLDFNFGSSPLALVLIAVAFTFCICALTLLLATFVQTEQQAGSVTTLLALTLAPIGGAWWSLNFEFIPEFMRTISYVSPIRYAMEGFAKVIYDNGGVVDVLPEVGVLLAIGAVLFVIASRRFKIA